MGQQHQATIVVAKTLLLAWWVAMDTAHPVCCVAHTAPLGSFTLHSSVFVIICVWSVHISNTHSFSLLSPLAAYSKDTLLKFGPLQPELHRILPASSSPHLVRQLIKHAISCASCRKHGCFSQLWLHFLFSVKSFSSLVWLRSANSAWLNTLYYVVLRLSIFSAMAINHTSLYKWTQSIII